MFSARQQRDQYEHSTACALDSLTAPNGRRVHIERHLHSRPAVPRARRGHREPRRAPALRVLARARREARERRRVAPREVRRAQRRAVRPAVLLGERAVRGGVRRVDRDEAVGERAERARERAVLRGAGRVRPRADAGGELLEEGEGRRGYLERALGGPDGQRVV